MAPKSGKDPDSLSDKLNYEELRRKRIEDNRKRLEELGLLEQASLFKKRPSKATTPRKTVKRSSFNPEESLVQTRRSPRVARKTSINYNETKVAALEEGPRRRKGIGRVLKRGFISPAARTEAALKATEVKTEHPSFVKAMLKSHVSGGFWLGLPSGFCDMHFSKDDLVILEDEDGLEWETIYLHHKHGLSGGWRGFSIDHDLEDGDALVFELVKPTRFKVYVTRVTDSKNHNADQKVATRKSSYRYALKENKENEHVNSALHKVLKMEQLQTEENIAPGRATTVKPSRKRKLDLSEPSTKQLSGGQQQTQVESSLTDTSSSDDVCPGLSKLTGNSVTKSGHRILRNRGPAAKGVLKSATSRESKKARKSGSERSTKTKPQRRNSNSQKRKGPQDNRAAAVVEDKGVVLTKRARVLNKLMEHKSEMQIATKNTPELPPGAKIKAVGFCSIVGNYNSTRKFPGMTLKGSSGKGSVARVQ